MSLKDVDLDYTPLFSVLNPFKSFIQNVIVPVCLRFFIVVGNVIFAQTDHCALDCHR